MTTATAQYEVIPMVVSAERAEINSRTIRKIAEYENIFDDFRPACEDACYKEKQHEEMCEDCFNRLSLISQSLLLPNARVWEVWKTDEEYELSGIIRVSRIVPGRDAVGHYVFFDGDLRGKTGVLKEVIAWLFADHSEDGWKALHRLTVEIPDFAYALARHANKRLGFGGELRYKPEKGSVLEVEGVRREAIRWRGQWRDMIEMGLLNES